MENKKVADKHSDFLLIYKDLRVYKTSLRRRRKVFCTLAFYPKLSYIILSGSTPSESR